MTASPSPFAFLLEIAGDAALLMLGAMLRTDLSALLIGSDTVRWPGWRGSCRRGRQVRLRCAEFRLRWKPTPGCSVDRNQMNWLRGTCETGGAEGIKVAATL